MGIMDWNLLKPGGLLVADNVLYGGLRADFAEDGNERGGFGELQLLGEVRCKSRLGAISDAARSRWNDGGRQSVQGSASASELSRTYGASPWRFFRVIGLTIL